MLGRAHPRDEGQGRRLLSLTVSPRPVRLPMIFDLTYRIDVDSTQKAIAIRDKLASLLDEDEDTTLINSTSAQALTEYTVKGVDTKTSKPFEETVEAESADQAEEQVVSKTRIVVGVE